MSLGRIALVTAGMAAGIFVGYAIKSEKLRPAAVSTVKAGLVAKDWTATQYSNLKEDVKSLARKARSSMKKSSDEIEETQEVGA